MSVERNKNVVFLLEISYEVVGMLSEKVGDMNRNEKGAKLIKKSMHISIQISYICKTCTLLTN